MDDVTRFFSGCVPLGSSLALRHTNNSNAIALTQPQLVILNHKAHSEEIISKNGVQKTVHIVVKSSPFHLQMGLANPNTCKVDFNQIAFDAQLIYDCDGDKEVDFVKVKPLEFKSTPSENGQILDTELRIKVLTSQHEDMLFKIRIAGSNPITREEIPGLAVISSPIKVISKPEQLKKRQPNKKRSLTEMLVETINRIERKQEDQQKLIERLIQQQSEQTAVALEKKQKIDNNNFTYSWEELSFNTPHQQTQTQTQTQTNIPQNNNKEKAVVVEFEDSFTNLVKAYNFMKPEEKSETIRKIIRNSSTRDTERLSELLDLFWTEGLQKEFGGVHSNARDRVLQPTAMMGKESDTCSCADCPHKLELERIDEFYKEFLSCGVSAQQNNEPHF